MKNTCDGPFPSAKLLDPSQDLIANDMNAPSPVFGESSCLQHRGDASSSLANTFEASKNTSMARKSGSNEHNSPNVANKDVSINGDITTDSVVDDMDADCLSPQLVDDEPIVADLGIDADGVSPQLGEFSVALTDTNPQVTTAEPIKLQHDIQDEVEQPTEEEEINVKPPSPKKPNRSTTASSRKRTSSTASLKETNPKQRKRTSSTSIKVPEDIEKENADGILSDATVNSSKNVFWYGCEYVLIK